MSYGSVSGVREKTNFLEAEIPEEEILSFLERANPVFKTDLLIPFIREKAEAIDASRRSFRVKYLPFADGNMDKKIDVEDLVVEVKDGNKYVEVSLASIEPLEGAFELEDSTDKEVYASFYIYPTKGTFKLFQEDIGIFDTAVDYLASAHLVEVKILFQPPSFSLGSLRIGWGVRGENPFSRLMRRYIETLDNIKIARSMGPRRSLD